MKNKFIVGDWVYVYAPKQLREGHGVVTEINKYKVCINMWFYDSSFDSLPVESSYAYDWWEDIVKLTCIQRVL